MSGETECLSSILSYLNSVETRCTYKAVAEILEIAPQSVGRRLGEKSPEKSWVVNSRTGEPTGYEDIEKHSNLRKNQRIITTGAELRRGLSTYEQHSDAVWRLEATYQALYLGAQKLVGPDTMNAPWSLESRLKLVQSAYDFFGADKSKGNHELIGKEFPNTGDAHYVPQLSVRDFLKYLEIKQIYPKAPNAYRVTEILIQMASTGILLRGGAGWEVNRSKMNERYTCFVTQADARRNQFRLVPVLGPEFLYRLCASGLVHIIGRNKLGDEVAGTGIVVDHSYVLTCRHVVCDMDVNTQQTFQGCEVNVQSIHAHPRVDVAVIQVDEPTLSPLEGALFQMPIVAQTVYTLGYPKLPGLKDATVTMQPGAVTNEAVTSLSGDSLFLYSAISRPGNSGGPVMSEEGYVVGLSVVDSTGQYDESQPFSPHYAGIPAQVVVSAVHSLDLGIQLPVETYE